MVIFKKVLARAQLENSALEKESARLTKQKNESKKDLASASELITQLKE
jgi:hypothetical protein